jgi:hypothetical protein
MKARFDTRVVVALVVGAFVGAAAAQDAERAPKASPQKFRKACKQNAEQLCAGTEPGDGRIAQCLSEKKGELGKECLTALRKAKRVSVFRAECGSDVKQLCAKVKPGGGRVLACLKSNDGSLSTACRARITRRVDKNAFGETQALADEASVEEQQGIEAVPVTVLAEEFASVEDTPALDAGRPAAME